MWLSVYDAQLHLPDAEESFASPYKILLEGPDHHRADRQRYHDYQIQNSNISYFCLQGVVRIKVIEAKDLIRADIGFTGRGKSDPYCKIRGNYNSETA